VTASEVAELWSDGTRLRADVYLPPGQDRSPAIVVCQGFGGTKAFLVPDLAAGLARLGYVVVVFDYRGFGESEGQRGRLHPLEQVADTRAALSWTAQHPRVEADRMGLLGVSFGGGIAVEAASRDVRVRATAAAVPVGDGFTWLKDLRRHWEWLAFLDRVEADAVARVVTGRSEEVDPGEIMLRDPASQATADRMRQEHPERAFRCGLDSASAILEFRPVERVHLIAPRALCVLGVAGDALTPLDQALALHERAGDPKQLVVLRGLAHHDIYEGTGLAQVLAILGAFFARHLETAADLRG
jgi:pimeloyl-ACP methyl ester carboxylesterase